MSETAAGAAAPPRWMPRGLLGDARLARLAAAGDPRAFETIFERYNAELYRYCRTILGNSDDAQDALQSTMTNALRSLPGDDRRIALRPWLYRVAHNESISIVRQRASGADYDEVPDPVAPGADLEAEVRERLKTLVADLDALPDRQRGALVMRELSGLSYSEIGTALGASDGAARQAVYEARVALQELKTGREMECETARRALSERDGRALRGRRLSAHLRACQPCRDFEAGISQRRSDLRALCPPLPALAASGLLTVLLGETGGGGAASGALGGSTAGLAGAAGTTVGTSAAVKGASIVAAVAIGTGAAGVSGAVNLPLVGHGHASPVTQATPASQRAADAARGESPAGQAHAGTETGSSASARHHGAASRGGHGHTNHARAAAGRAHGQGNSAHGKPANTGNGTSSAASNGTPPGHSTSDASPGNSGSSAASGGSPGNSAHSSAGGSSNSKAPASPPGLERAAANAPTLPEQAHGKPGSPPGHASSSDDDSSGTS